MYKCLSPGAIGVRTANLEEAIAAAKTGGFAGVEINVGEVADRDESGGADEMAARFAAADIRPGGWGLPVDWRSSEENWKRDMERLPRLAAAAQAIGCTRTSTWVLSGSNDRPFDENRRFHVERFKPVAALLADHGCSLGLEFLGPKTIKDSLRYPFIDRMGAMLELGAEIGPNVGLLLDCWHWYTSHGTVEELHALRPEQVVYVHVNDAPAGVEIDKQVDNVRGLPGETGVIPIADFLGALQAIGYDGPVTPEPFKKELGDLPSDEARLKKVGAAMDKIFAQARL
jgi:sugar phosphate isomerase/epimerase